MDQSQRRISGKAAPNSGHRLKLFALLTLAISAAGYFAIASTNFWSGALVEGFGDSDCNRADYSGPGGSPACDFVAASTAIQHVSGSSDRAIDKPNPPNRIQGDVARSLQGRHASKPRAWYDDRSISASPRSGYTMAELCSAGLDDNEFRCRTASYDEAFTTSESGTTSGSVSGYTISGHVLTTEGAGLSGIRIVASPERLKGKRISESAALRFWTVTDSIGAYALSGLPDGEYTVRSSTHGPYQSTRISVRAGVTYADLVVSRNLSRVVEGQVLGSAGETLEGVTVLPVLLGQPSVLTGDDGHFRLPVTLKPTIKSFALRFQRPGYREQTGTVDFRHRGALSGAAVNVVMHPVESWTSVFGTVRGDSGAPLAGRMVELRPRSAQQTLRTTTDQLGEFTFSIVESPADYGLIVFGGADYKDYQHPVHVTPDMDELEVVAESYEFGAVTGQLVNLNGVPVPNFDLVLRNTASRKPNILVSTDQLGNFDIPAAPAGELVIASQSTPAILVQGLQLRPGEKLYLPLVLDWGEHEIRGVVVDAYGNPVPASRIVLQWSHRAGGITTSATRRTAADTQGHFAFSHLGPGPHSLQIDAPGYSTADINHDLSRQGYDLTVRLN
jgi:hypothetical protein